MDKALAIERLKALTLWPGSPAIDPISGGRTNENFCITADGHKYFARIGVDLPHHGIARANELRCHRLAAAAGVAPQVIYASDGVMVTEFFEGATLIQGQPIADATLTRLARTLRRLHDAPVPAMLAVFDPVAICRRDLAIAGLSAKRRKQAERMLATAPVLKNRSLLHADLIPENVIVAPDRLVLVDWEYSGLGDPAVDVASVVLHFGMERRQAELFVVAHHAADPAVVTALQPILALREALWCEVQQRFAGLRGDLADYSEMCWQRLDRMA